MCTKEKKKKQAHLREMTDINIEHTESEIQTLYDISVLIDKTMYASLLLKCTL
jgi:hypothetical protein